MRNSCTVDRFIFGGRENKKKPSHRTAKPWAERIIFLFMFEILVRSFPQIWYIQPISYTLYEFHLKCTLNGRHRTRAALYSMYIQMICDDEWNRIFGYSNFSIYQIELDGTHMKNIWQKH